MADTPPPEHKGNLLDEWKHASKQEKTVIVLVIVGVVGIAIYLYIRSQQNAASTSPTGPSTVGNTGTGGQVAGYPSVGSAGTPVLPQGINPIFDPNGNLIAFGPGSSGTNGGTTLPGSGTSNGTGTGNGTTSGGTTSTGTGTGSTSTGSGGTALNWFQQQFGMKPEISQQNGKFLLVQRSGGKVTGITDIATLFPSGTKFSGGGQGRAWAEAPGQKAILITQGGYGKPNLTPSNTTVAKVAAK